MTGAVATESNFETGGLEPDLIHDPRRRWVGWRLRLLLLAALGAGLGLLLLIEMLAGAPRVDALWKVDQRGQLALEASPDPRLIEHVGSTLRGLSSRGREPVAVDAFALEGTPRWLVEDGIRARLVRERRTLAEALTADSVTLHFADGTSEGVEPRPRGLAGLPLLFWLLALLAAGVFMAGAVVVLARPQVRNLLYALMATALALSLLWMGVDTIDDLGAVPHLPVDSLPWRVTLELVVAAATVHVFAFHPRRLRAAPWIGVAAWGGAAALAALVFSGQAPALWWWGQGSLLAYGATALLVVTFSFQRVPNPAAAVLRRLGIVAWCTLALITLAVGTTDSFSTTAYAVATSTAIAWYVFYASLVLLVPFLWRSRQLMREFAMLAGLGTLTTTLDLLFVTVFALSQFTSLTLALFLSLAAYAAARQWMLNRILGPALMPTERTFEQLYRVARQVRQQPERHAELLAQLLRDLFEPLEVQRLPRRVAAARVVADGAGLLVPAHGPGPSADADPVALLLQFARRGQRIFTYEDARLTNRIVEQFRRAVAYDAAVERGRSEERQRIAQDLHDDIGARLLTLIYKSTTPEMEDYVRHTLKDLKTLTRGLAASQHWLSHATAEWKTDIQQRLTAADVDLAWSFYFEHDIMLSVVQWSALTRILRELVSNTLHHGHAGRVDIAGTVVGRTLTITVSDDGVGRDPDAWSHGLGLAGVRKRVRLLNGNAQWRENGERGIVCEVTIPDLSAPL